jgi:transcriptional regulator with XRE-family HTH domain
MSVRGDTAVDKSIYSTEQKVLQELLRQIRLDAGLSQKELAERISEPQSLVSKYESGERRLDLVELRQVCEALGISFTAFVTRLEEGLRESGR